eukprot:1677185-Amphidinium_carterae.1
MPQNHEIERAALDATLIKPPFQTLELTEQLLPKVKSTGQERGSSFKTCGCTNLNCNHKFEREHLPRTK